VDKKVELGLADNKMTADLFCLVFKPVEGDVALPEDAQSEDNRKVHEAAVSRREQAERVERLAKGFAVKVPELKFSRFFWNIGNHWRKPLTMWSNSSRSLSEQSRSRRRYPKTPSPKILS